MNAIKIGPKVVGALVILAICALPALAQAGITIDGDFSDWTTAATHIDPGGVDDETSPARSDITEFKAEADATNLYLVMAWDDTDFGGGNASTAGVTISSPYGYYRIYLTAQGTGVPLSSLEVARCIDTACKSTTLVCSGTACSGAAAASGLLADPFTHVSGCSGPNCTTQDMAVEAAIPWDLLGGPPGPNQMVALDFSSYPSDPGQGPKDVTGPNGIGCRDDGTGYFCYPSTPTAIVVSGSQVTAPAMSGYLIAAAGAAVLAVVGLTAALRVRRN